MKRSVVGIGANALLALSLVGTLSAASGADAASSHTTGAPRVAHTMPAAHVRTLINIPQTWNNCGPASVAEVLDFWGIERSQAQVQLVLRADQNPGGMAPYGVTSYARSLGLRSVLGVDGTPAIVKTLIGNGYPVIVSQWVSMSDRYGHYRPIEAYDDRRGVFISSDPYLGPDHTISYADFARMWQSTNRRFMVLYPPSQQQRLDRVLASAGWDKLHAYQQDLALQKERMRKASQQRGAHSWVYNYAAIAWDELQLGDTRATQTALTQARAHGTNPVVLAWIRAELAARR